MKKIGTSLLFLAALLLTSCLSNTHQGNKINPISSLFMQADQSASEVDSSVEEIESSDQVSISSIDFPKYENIDVDLTQMNATMVYSEVYNMLYYPDEYVGKIVKINGPFLPFDGTEYTRQ